ncbi:helix-turn-helix domain-containing protein [Xylophilus sp. GW821-FHT01B05]
MADRQQKGSSRRFLSALRSYQSEQIKRTLQACGGKVARAARALGASPDQIYGSLKKPGPAAASTPAPARAPLGKSAIRYRKG